MKPAQYASNLRRRRKNNETLDEKDIAWLAEYESQVKRGRPRTSEAPPLTTENVPTGAPDEPPPHHGAPVDPPPIDVSSPSPGPTEQHATDRTGEPVGGSAERPGEGEPYPAKSEAHLKKCAALAGYYGDWMKKQHAILRVAGYPSLSDDIIDGLITPSANVAFVAYLPEGISERGAAVITAGSGLYTVVGARRARADQKKKEAGPRGEKYPAGSNVSVKQPPPKHIDDDDLL
jgi:hypothetical protein